MAIVETTIATAISSRFTFPSSGHLLRDYEGTLYALVNGRADVGPTIKASVYTSTDDGSTWNLLAMDDGLGGPGNGGNQPSLMLGLEGEVYLGMYRSDGNARFEVFQRGASSWDSVWQFVPMNPFDAPGSSDRAVFKVGKQRTPGAGTVPVFHLAWTEQTTNSDAWYTSSVLGAEVEYLGYGTEHTVFTELDMALDRVGFPHFSLVVTEEVTGDVNVWYGRRSEPYRFNLERVSPAGVHDTIGNETIITLQNGTPIVLYTMRDAATGPVRLYSGHRGATGRWRRSEIWDGDVHLDHAQGTNTVAVDQQNRPVVIARAVPTDNAAEEYETTLYEKSGPIWVPTFISNQNLNVLVPNSILYDDSYRTGGSSPSRPLRGWAAIYWLKNGAARDLIYARTSTIAFDGIVASAEEPAYRVPPLLDRDSVVLAGESEAAGETLPATSLPGYGWQEEKSFLVSDLRMDVGYSTRLSLQPDGRRRVEVQFEPMNKTDRDALETFLSARNFDEEPFDFPLPVRGIDLRCILEGSSVQFRKVDGDVYTCSLTVVEVFVTPDRTLILGLGEVEASYPG